MDLHIFAVYVDPAEICQSCSGLPIPQRWSLIFIKGTFFLEKTGQVQITGPDAYKLIEFLTPRDMSGCSVGQGQYILLTDEE